MLRKVHAWHVQAPAGPFDDVDEPAAGGGGGGGGCTCTASDDEDDAGAADVLRRFARSRARSRRSALSMTFSRAVAWMFSRVTWAFSRAVSQRASAGSGGHARPGHRAPCHRARPPKRNRGKGAEQALMASVLFYLNGERVELFDCDPFTLTSTFVRSHGLTGTKGAFPFPKSSS